ncbi:LacI family DNA-binding transcriptional regulator [Saccharothrix texasensis]|uniref:DNA-binding LacI/PurR family transcriptional regulator n=1 Tax=Saccharothrix texasensis TaxID=103734 RepID=A0A3N1HIU8_9PSEU|nr:LacI family DNA-binding transcriptional regulator [Saccharothrix texasensis]ROP42467.1 DNA-binding LacI/PurR family transcriptional regulator [Saccharothrix texasensis]
MADKPGAEARGAMLPAARRQWLLEHLAGRGVVRITHIAQAMGVTPVTVRRDVNDLAAEGLVERVHGGVRLVDDLPAEAGGADATPAIGMVVPSLDYYWPEVIRGAQDTAHEKCARLVLRGASYQVDDVRHQVEWMIGSGAVDALLVAPPTRGAGAEELLAWLTALPVPVVLVERSAVSGPYRQHVESVRTDHAAGAELAVRHLHGRGHRGIGLAISATSPTSGQVRDGWHHAMTDLGLTPAPEVSVAAYYEPGWAVDVDRVLDLCAEHHATALVVHSDREAVSLVQRAEERGIRVPADLSVVAYDDEVARFAHPPLTAVRPPKYAVGSTAVHLALERLAQGPDRPVRRVVLSSELRERASTDARTRAVR